MGVVVLFLLLFLFVLVPVPLSVIFVHSDCVFFCGPDCLPLLIRMHARACLCVSLCLCASVCLCVSLCVSVCLCASVSLCVQAGCSWATSTRRFASCSQRSESC